MTTIAPRDAERLAKCLGMLGSAHDGEVVAAARHAERIRASLGLLWSDIVGLAAPEHARHPDWRDDAQFCREHDAALTNWEKEFIASIMLRWSLTSKQQAVLDRIVAKCREHADPWD